VEFKFHGDGMKSAKSLRRKIQFKLWQCLLMIRLSFMMIRLVLSFTVETTNGKSDGHPDPVDVHLDWDFLPVSIILCVCFMGSVVIVWLVFDTERELNCKVYNEILNIRRTNIQT
jgi:hypothetical protein